MKDERPGRTMRTTVLVHETYLRLIDVKNVEWQHRAHVFAISAQIMRRILLDAARRRTAAKRGGGTPRVNLDEIPDVSTERSPDANRHLEGAPANVATKPLETCRLGACLRAPHFPLAPFGRPEIDSFAQNLR